MTFGVQMLDRNPTTRIGFSEILAHPIFALLDWNRVANLQYSRESIITLLSSLDAAVILILSFSNVGFPRGRTLEGT